MDQSSAYIFGMIIGIIITGAIVGAIPLISGAVKGKIGLGLGGFFACLVCQAILGLLLSLPCCGLFMYFIFKNNNNSNNNNMNNNFNNNNNNNNMNF